MRLRVSYKPQPQATSIEPPYKQAACKAIGQLHQSTGLDCLTLCCALLECLVSWHFGTCSLLFQPLWSILHPLKAVCVKDCALNTHLCSGDGHPSSQPAQHDQADTPAAPDHGQGALEPKPQKAQPTPGTHDRGLSSAGFEQPPAAHSQETSTPQPAAQPESRPEQAPSAAPISGPKQALSAQTGPEPAPASPHQHSPGHSPPLTSAMTESASASQDQHEQQPEQQPALRPGAQVASQQARLLKAEPSQQEQLAPADEQAFSEGGSGSSASFQPKLLPHEQARSRQALTERPAAHTSPVFRSASSTLPSGQQLEPSQPAGPPQAPAQPKQATEHQQQQDVEESAGVPHPEPASQPKLAAGLGHEQGPDAAVSQPSEQHKHEPEPEPAAAGGRSASAVFPSDPDAARAHQHPSSQAEAASRHGSAEAGGSRLGDKQAVSWLDPQTGQPSAARSSTTTLSRVSSTLSWAIDEEIPEPAADPGADPEHDELLAAAFHPPNSSGSPLQPAGFGAERRHKGQAHTSQPPADHGVPHSHFLPCNLQD